MHCTHIRLRPFMLFRFCSLFVGHVYKSNGHWGYKFDAIYLDTCFPFISIRLLTNHTDEYCDSCLMPALVPLFLKNEKTKNKKTFQMHLHRRTIENTCNRHNADQGKLLIFNEKFRV